MQKTMRSFPPGIGASPDARLVAVAAALVLMTAACGGTAAPTASPSPPPATASPSPSPEATQGATATTAAPTLIPYPGPSIPPGTLTISIRAIEHLKFDLTEMTAPADTPFVIAFENQDLCDASCQKVYSYPLASIPHNVAIKSGGELLFNPMPTIFAPAKADYFISEGLPAGTYTFVCIVHAQMTGTLTIN